MNVRRRRTAQTLVVLGLWGTGTGAEAAEAEASPALPLAFRVAPEAEAPPAEEDGFSFEDESTDEAPAEDEGDDGFAVEDESEEPIDEGTVVMPAAPPEDDGPVMDVEEEDGDWTFEIEDISEDEGAIEEEVKASTVEAQGTVGTVSGRILDSVSGDPIIGGVVEVIGKKYKTKTDAAGEFALDLPPGIYEIRLRSDSSQPLRVSNVEVEVGKTIELKRELTPLEGAGQVVEVEAEMNRESEGARLEQRKKSVSARDLMSRDEISKSGGGSTSAVARRIVGSTVVGGRFLFVRGLGHRYGNTLFDGARVPSPEPELRTVPLDIFPSGALSAINIQKTFTPDVPGDFAGGSTQLESRDVPEELIFEVSADVGANTATTGRQMITGAGFLGADAFGFGNLPRAIPEVLPENYAVGPSQLNDTGVANAWTIEETERFGESLLTDTRVRRSAKAPPNFGLKATTGYGFEYGDDGGKLGFLVSGGYKSKHSTIREQQRQYGVGEDGTLDTATPNVDFDGMRTTYNVAWSGIGLVKWRANDNHRLELLGFYSRDADDETRALSGDARSVSPDPVINTRLRYITRSILMTRLGGKHTFPRAKDLEIDWFGSYAQARRDDPSMRDMVFSTDNAEGPTLDLTNGGGKQLFLDLVDDTESGAVNLSLPFQQWGQLDSKFKTGVWIEGKQRQFFARRLALATTDPDQIPVGTGDILSPDVIGGGRTDPQPLYYNETTRANDNYEAEQEIYATYAQVDLPMVRWFKVSGGARFEASFIDVNPYDIFARNRGESGIDEEQTASLTDYDVLPSLSLIFSPNDKMNVRLVGTQTLARPEFRELAPFEFTDFVGGSTVLGNPALVSSKIWNADLRWEFFPSVAEVVAVSVFYKYFDQPIERTAGPRIPRLVSFRNARRAQNLGAELEARKNLSFIGDALDDFSLGANFAYVFSRVELGEVCNPATDPLCDTAVPDVSTSRERPLQGQSPFVVNAYLDYADEDSGTSARLLYNAFGRRIYEVGGLGLPDTYEEAVHNFDFVLGQEIYEGLTLSAGIENILNYPRRFTQGENKDITHLWWTGTTFTLGLSYKI